MNLTQEQFDNYMMEKTGKVMGNDYGFIMGTHTPFSDTKGMMSASMKTGYTIWKKNKDGSYTEKNIIPYQEKNHLNTLINFLNDTSFKIKLSKTE